MLLERVYTASHVHVIYHFIPSKSVSKLKCICINVKTDPEFD